MSIDDTWLSSFETSHDLSEVEYFEVEGVEVDVPSNNDQWQGRVMPDVFADSPNRDAPEKMTYRIVNNLTAPIRTPRTLAEVMEGDGSVLESLVLRKTQGGTDIPVAFHVLVAKGFGESVDVRNFTEQTFLMLLTDQDGEVRSTLADRFLNRFQHAADDLGLAERFVVENLQPNRLDETSYGLELEGGGAGVAPFAPDAAALFREDLKKLLDAEAPPADFFRNVNALLSLHFGLYVPRIAWRLNPSVECLIEAVSEPEAVPVSDIKRLERGNAVESEFRGRLELRAPSFGTQRTVSRTGGPHETYKGMARQTERLHFSLIAFQHLRRLTEQYVRQKVGDLQKEAMFEQVRYPSVLAKRLRTHPDFSGYLDRGFTALSVIFIKRRLQGDDAEDAHRYRKRAANGLDWFVRCLECYNRRGGKDRTDSRAYRQGIQVVRGLLAQGADGIIHSRRGVGSYFELGTGLVPLLLLLTVGPGRKLQLRDFWEELERYGFHFAPEEQQLLLRRLKSMGLYERYSDAGAANYVRSLAVARSA